MLPRRQLPISKLKLVVRITELSKHCATRLNRRASSSLNRMVEGRGLGFKTRHDVVRTVSARQVEYGIKRRKIESISIYIIYTERRFSVCNLHAHTPDSLRGDSHEHLTETRDTDLAGSAPLVRFTKSSRCSRVG